MGTPYSAIYKRFLQKITDYKLLSLPEEDVEEILYGYLTSSIVKFRTIQSDLSKRDDEAQCFEDTLLDVEIEILALQMVCEWVEPQLNNELYTKQFIGTKEEKFFAQSNHLEKLQTLRNDAELRSKKLRRDYSYQNSDYFKR
jgi:hypothetical protein